MHRNRASEFRNSSPSFAGKTAGISRRMCSEAIRGSAVTVICPYRTRTTSDPPPPDDSASPKKADGQHAISAHGAVGLYGNRPPALSAAWTQGTNGSAPTPRKTPKRTRPHSGPRSSADDRPQREPYPRPAAPWKNTRRGTNRGGCLGAALYCFFKKSSRPSR